MMNCFSHRKDIPLDVLTSFLHRTDPVSRPRSVDPSCALTWDPFCATPRLQISANPPFSLFREYVAQLMEYRKDFIIIGNQNAITYKEIFPLFMQNKIWYGASIHSHGRDFRVPDDYPLQAYEFRTDENGIKYINVKGVRWFTNIDYKERHEKLILYKPYSAEAYPKYDNYDAIEVSKTADIPCDYDGVMGVPISFMDKYIPEQFEILGCSDNGAVPDEYKLPHFKRHNEPYVAGKKLYKRIFIRRKQETA